MSNCTKKEFEQGSKRSKKIMSEYSIPYFETYKNSRGSIVNGLRFLKKGKKFFTSFLSWAPSVKRRFKMSINNPVSFDYPILENKNAIKVLHDNIEDAQKPDYQDKIKEYKKKLQDAELQGNKEKVKAIKFNMYLSSLEREYEYMQNFLQDFFGKHAYCVNMLEIDNLTNTYRNGKKNNKDRWKRQVKRAFEFCTLEDKLNKKDKEKAFVDMCSNAMQMPFPFPEPILDCYDGYVVVIVTKENVYYMNHRCI
jgi:hypothetical protein